MADSSRAATLIGWDFTGVNNYGSDPLAANYEIAGMDSSGLTRASGVGTSGTASANAWGGTGWSNTTAAGAFTSGQYFSFSMTAAEGTTFSLTSINAYNILRAETANNMRLQWQYSVDGTNFFDAHAASSGNLSGSSNSKAAINLSGISALQDISEVTFRIGFYFFNTSVDADTELYFQNGTATDGYYLSVAGNYDAVPEPSTYALLGAGALVLYFAVRRRKATA